MFTKVSGPKFSLLVFSLTCLLICLVLNYVLPASFQTPLWFSSAVFFFLFGLSTQAFLLSGITDENKNTFTFRFLGVTGIKLFSSLITLIVFRFIDPLHFKGFTLLFLLNYFLFTFHEIRILFQHLKKAAKK